MDFNRDIFDRKLKLWKDRFVDEWKDVSIEPDRRFVFDLSDGRTLDVCSYHMKDVTSEEAKYSDIYFMLAKVGNRVVGFSEVGLRKDNGAEIKMGGIDIAVNGEVRGVGTRLVEINGLIFQELANERGSVDDVEGDENSEYVKEFLDLISSDTQTDSENKKKVLGQMVMNRQKWLKFFGEGGKIGYQWDKDRENLYKRYHHGDELPRLNCVIEPNETDLRKELGIEKNNKKSDRYEAIRCFEADQRFVKEDFGNWSEGKLDKDGYKEKLRSLEERGFQEYFPQITLTKTEFQKDAKFLTVQNKDAKKEAERVLREIETETGKQWQLEVIVETYEQNQKKMRIFIREKYYQKALVEIAEQMKLVVGEQRFREAEEKDDYVNGVYLFLKNGSIDKARADFENQLDKPEYSVDRDLYKFLCEFMYDDDVLSPFAKREKWRLAMLNDE